LCLPTCGRWPAASPPCSARPCPRPSASSPARWTASAPRARAVLGQALTVEAQGGLALPDGHRRTPGGVFFYLVRTSDAISREDKDDIFPRQGGLLRRAVGDATPAAAPAPVAWTDETYRTLARQLQQGNPGRATTVKITVIGRPGTVVEQGQAVALALVSEKVPDLPKGLPEPAAGTRYTVFVARKQWAKVAEALATDPEDAAIIEGYAVLDNGRVEGVEGLAQRARGDDPLHHIFEAGIERHGILTSGRVNHNA